MAQCVCSLAKTGRSVFYLHGYLTGAQETGGAAEGGSQEPSGLSVDGINASRGGTVTMGVAARLFGGARDENHSGAHTWVLSSDAMSCRRKTVALESREVIQRFCQGSGSRC